MIFSKDHIENTVKKYGTPLFMYSKEVLKEQAQQMLNISAPYGMTIRYAMKANSFPAILRTFKEAGIHIDASSGYEVEKALEVGFEPADILLTSQQLAHNLKSIVERGVAFNATSLHQLEAFGKAFPGAQVSVRINPGVGSGHSTKTNVGGLTSSFGIWHTYISEVQKLAKQYNLTIHRVHTHIGSGADPAVWQQVIHTNLEIIKNFPEATHMNLGGGFKVARVEGEVSANMAEIGETLARELKDFYKETGRKLHLELEPGTFLVANAGVLVAKVMDVVDTGKDGYRFLKLNTGMNDIIRPSLYGSQHPIEVINNQHETEEYVVVGHNCESGDLLTPKPGEPEVLQPRLLSKAAIGDLVYIGGTGAYCASMAAHGYNSYPDATETLV